MPRTLLTIHLLLLLSSQILASQDQLLTLSKDNSPICSCYLTSGPSPGYFQYHRFFDFRSIPVEYLPPSNARSDSASESDPDSTSTPELTPQLVTSPDANMDPSSPYDVTSAFFETEDWLRDWSIQNFSSEDVSTGGRYRQIASPRNIWVSGNCGGGDEGGGGGGGTCLVLRSSREEEGFQSVVEVDSNQANLWYSSIRARLRVIPTSEFAGDDGGNATSTSEVDPGAVLGLFTYGTDTSESDIEILTRDPAAQIRYSNQPDYDEQTQSEVPGASTAAVLPKGKKWTEWIDHRIDWFEGESRWYVNGELVLSKSVNVPGEVGRLILNLWGDGGEWSGVMSVGGEVRVQVEWVQMVFNVSGGVEGESENGKVRKRKEAKCEVGCWVDGEGEGVGVGFPVLAFNSTTSAAVRWHGGLRGRAWEVLVGQVVVLSIMLQVVM